MSWWRKSNLGDAGSENGWIKLKSIWRKSNPSDPGSESGWTKIKSIWRYQGGGVWYRIFGGEIPYPNVDGPKLWFIESPYDSSAYKTQDADVITGAAWQKSKMYVERGKWENDPLSIAIRIERSHSQLDWSSPTIILPEEELEYTEYSDNDSLDEVPENKNSRPIINLADIKNKYVFRARVRAGSSANPSGEDYALATFYYPNNLGIAPRLKFAFNPYSDGEVINEEETLSDKQFKIFGLKWRYQVSSADSYPNGTYFPDNRIYEFIGKQIVELTDFNGNRIGLLQDINPSMNPQLSTISYTQAMIDSGDDYIINIYSVANDWYYDASLTLDQHINSNTETIIMASYVFTPPIDMEDPTITISNRTKAGFNAEWYSSTAEKYEVDITNNLGTSLFGYPKITEDTSATIFGLSENTQYEICVKALAGAQNQHESNVVCKCVRTITTGISPQLGEPFAQGSNSFQISINNFSFIDPLDGWDIQVYATNGNATRSGSIITVSDVLNGIRSCVNATSSNINEVDLCVQSWELANSNEQCETLGTWYCRRTTTTGSCSVTIESYDASEVDGPLTIQCSLNQICCSSVTYGSWGDWSYTEYGNWGPCTQCQKAKIRTATRSRTKTTINLDCTQVTVEESETKTFTTPAAISGETCLDCIEYENCCCTPSSTTTLGTKTYTGPGLSSNQYWSEYGNCIQGERARYRNWTAIETTVSTLSDCSKTTTTKEVNGVEYDYTSCCTVSCTLSNKVYTGVVTYDNCIQGQRAKKTWYTATETCINSSCQETVTQVERFDTDYVACCTASCTTGTKTYTGPGSSSNQYWSAWSSCNQGERSRYRSWTALQTCIDIHCNSVTTEVNGNEFEYTGCCTAGTSCTTGTKTYSAWSAWSNCQQGEQSRYRSWTAIETCTTTDTSCNTTTTTIEVNGNEFEYRSCCTASCTTGTKTYSAWSAWSNCQQGQISRSRTWTATETCTTTSCTTTTSQVSGTEFEYANCCTASCTTGTKTYSAWSAWSNCQQGERSRYRTWTAIETCTTTSCTTTTTEVNGTEYEYTGCCTAGTTCTTGTKTYSAWSDWSTCRQGEQSRYRTWTAITTCTTTDTSCNVTTTSSEDSGNEFEYRNCSSTTPPFFPPHFPPFFPPHFPPHFPPFFPPHFPPFFPPHFPQSSPFFPPHFPPFFPPHFPPHFPPFFPPHFPPFFPPHFPPGGGGGGPGDPLPV